jgi:hypothetical protein
MSDNFNWPDSKSVEGSPEHFHALGVITATYNSLELELFLLFTKFVVSDFTKARQIFDLLSKRNVIQLIKTAVEADGQDADARELALHFIKGFESAEFNRNFLSHSLVSSHEFERGHLTFGKTSRRQSTWTFAHLTVLEIRKIADEMLVLRRFGTEANVWLINRGKVIFGDGHVEEVPYPTKPPLPEKLSGVPYYNRGQ